jgi:hypothetical protein
MPRTIDRTAIAISIFSVLTLSSIAWSKEGALTDSDVKASMAQAESKAMTRAEYLQRRIYENELMNQRLNWLLASQTLLFAGYGAVLSASLRQQIKESIAKVAVTLGAFSALLIWLGIIAAFGASIHLTMQFGDQDFIKGLFAWTNLVGWSVPFLLPLLFIGAWVKLPTMRLT